MLLDVIQNWETGGFVIIRDTVECCGRQLWKSCITAALQRDELVHVIAFEVSEEDLRVGLDSRHVQRLCFHDGYTDPLGWAQHTPSTARQLIPHDVSSWSFQSEQSKPVMLFVDSLSWLLRHHPPVFICQRLQELRRGGAVRKMVALLHSDLHLPGVVESVCHLATAVVSVRPGVKAQQALAKTTKRTKSGKVTQEDEYFSVNDNLMVTVETKPSCQVQMEADQDECEVDPAANLTFNLHLSDMEKEAKERLSLPFVFSQEKKSALLHNRPGSGRIVYEPDASDDFDQEDPDDDLDV